MQKVELNEHLERICKKMEKKESNKQDKTVQNNTFDAARSCTSLTQAD